MNLTLNETPSHDIFCATTRVIYEVYIEITIGFIGIILNLFNIIVFFILVRDKHHRDDLFKYLFVKSLVDTYLSLYVFIFQIFDRIKFQQERILVFQIFYLVVFIYFAFAFELLSMFLEVVSIWNIYRTFGNKGNRKTRFKLAIYMMVLYSFGFYVYKLVDYRIEPELVNNSTETIYKINGKKLGQLSIIFGYIHSITRDGICVLLIFILNMLILVKMKRVILRKKTLKQRDNVIERGKVDRTELRLSLPEKKNTGDFFAYFQVKIHEFKLKFHLFEMNFDEFSGYKLADFCRSFT